MFFWHKVNNEFPIMLICSSYYKSPKLTSVTPFLHQVQAKVCQSVSCSHFFLCPELQFKCHPFIWGCTFPSSLRIVTWFGVDLTAASAEVPEKCVRVNVCLSPSLAPSFPLSLIPRLSAAATLWSCCRPHGRRVCICMCLWQVIHGWKSGW